MNIKTMDVASLLKLRGDIDKALADKRKELEGQLAAFDAKTNGSKHHLAGKKVPPTHRSLKDPKLTWASRGQKPKWLVAEMKATKKPLSAFAVK